MSKLKTKVHCLVCGRKTDTWIDQKNDGYIIHRCDDCGHDKREEPELVH